MVRNRWSRQTKRRGQMKTIFFVILLFAGAFLIVEWVGLFNSTAYLKPQHISADARDMSLYISEHTEIEVSILKVYGPLSSFSSENSASNALLVRIKNTGNRAITRFGWSIYFNCMATLHGNVNLETKRQISLSHVEGGLFKIIPEKAFETIQPGENAQFKFGISSPSVVRHFVFPRWYVMGLDEQAYVIRNTDDDGLGFVTILSKHYETLDNTSQDLLTAEERYRRYKSPFKQYKEAPLRILPTPVYSRLRKSRTVNIVPDQWVVCGRIDEFNNEIEILRDFFNFNLLNKESCPSSKYVRFTQGGLPFQSSNESYKLRVTKSCSCIDITANAKPGAFYAVQSLISLAEHKVVDNGYSIPTGVVSDWPRFQHRGLHFDVARNFRKAEEVIEIIETMSLYKLNKLHFHLTDDEGWRLEIDGLPELTEFGAFRRHDGRNSNFLLPSLGSGPHGGNSGSGYYTKTEYREILRVAEAHHVQVIPEIDVPGHSRAAIKAMAARYKRFTEEGNLKEAKQFLIDDFTKYPYDNLFDTSKIYVHNVLNPCLNSTYRFLEHVVQSIIKFHEPVQPLKTLHIGGDEVENLWQHSHACQDLVEKTKKRGNYEKRHGSAFEKLHEVFFQTFAEICTKKYGLNIGVWGDGLFRPSKEEAYLDKSEDYFGDYEPAPIKPFKKPAGNRDTIAFAWTSKLEERLAMLKAGYKIVLAEATYLYFDHPAEPDPEEIGLRWAGENIDGRRVFSFAPISYSGIRQVNSSAEFRKNIYGIQGNLWSELLRDKKWVHHQLFPRLIALAERAWHKADWEDADYASDMVVLKKDDWSEFSAVVGYKELPRLKKRNIAYRIPTPGAEIKNGRLYLTSLYPGFTFKCRVQKSGYRWSTCVNGQLIENASYFLYATDSIRSSRIVELNRLKERQSDSTDKTVF